MSTKKKLAAWAETGFEDWGGYMAAKKAKLEDQFLEEAGQVFKNATNLFQGIAIFVNGYTNPTADELRRLMMEHGGVYHHYLRTQATTHIIASNLPYSKILTYRKSLNPLPICKPEWITESIKAKKLLNYKNYLLYSNCTEVQPQLKFQTNYEESKISIHDWDNNADVLSKISIGKEICDKNEMKQDKAIDDKNSKQSTSSDSKNNARCTKDENFLSEFYSNSRLHHISTMGATFKEYINELREKNGNNFPGLNCLIELKKGKSMLPMSYNSDSDEDLFLTPEKMNPSKIQNPVIMHIDMDCFFVSVSLRNKPELKGFPIAVTHARGNKPSTNNYDDNIEKNYLESLSEIASCSYEARKAGVKNGMFLGEALKLCPNLRTVQYDFEGYKEVSYTLYNTIASYTLDIEAVSCDEMYVDCTKILEKTRFTPLEFASIIRDEIKNKTGCPVSTGFGNNKLQARLATKKAKPDGMFYLKKEDAQTHIATFNVKDLPGVGYTTAHRLSQLNVKTCEDLQLITLGTLQKEFGKKTGEILYNMCRGIDKSTLNLEHIRKSVSAEVNYGIRFENNGDAVNFLKKLSLEVCNRLQKISAKGRLITLKLMIRSKEAPKETKKFMGHGMCDYFTKSKNIMTPVDDVNVITKDVISLWNQADQIPADIRGIGIQISKLETKKNKHSVNSGSLINFVKKCVNSNTNYESANQIHPTKDLLHNKVKNAQKLICTDKRNTEETSYGIENISTNVSIKPLGSEVSNNNHFTISNNHEIANELDFLVPSQGIDNSILNELPEDMRTKIMKVQSLRKDSKLKETKMQTRQENYFKQVKPSTSKCNKVQLPPVQEIDMAVLVELPEDIRNEILNEYSNKTNSNENILYVETKSHSTTSQMKAENNVKNVELHNNLSFTQIDPEFLAALTDDMKNDVKMYCRTVKHRKHLETKRNIQQTILEKPWNGLKPGVKPEKCRKKNNNIRKDGSNKNSKKKLPSLVVKKTDSKHKPDVKSENEKSYEQNCGAFENDNFLLQSTLNKIITVVDNPTDSQEIISHNRTLIDDEDNVDQFQTALVNIVNRLFSLSLSEVQMQIQTWVDNSRTVNDTDFLSLATFLSMLPGKKRIEDLHVLLKTMHRCTMETRNCIWHRTYRKTIKHVQRFMQIEYNSNLMVPSIKCDSPKCNNNDVI